MPDSKAVERERERLAERGFPQFSLSPEQVTVLYTPQQFRSTLIDLCRNARRRIVLAALYIGTAPPEREVIDAIAEACRAAESRARRRGAADGASESGSAASTTPGSPSDEETSSAPARAGAKSGGWDLGLPLTVDVLIDSIRGQRIESGASSLNVLEPLLVLKDRYNRSRKPQTKNGKAGKEPLFNAEDYDDDGLAANERRVSPNNDNDDEQTLCSINLSLFHSPLLSGLLYNVLPHRMNEVLGVFHSKVFIVDDCVVLTGANLSAAYLTNRQDRYIVVHGATELADFLHAFVRLVQSFSFDVASLDNDVPSLDDSHRAMVRWPETRRSGVVLGVVPNPIKEPEAFRRSLGLALTAFLQRTSRTIIIPPEKNPNGSTTTTTTVVMVALQAGFCLPPLEDEKCLLGHILSSRSRRQIERIVLASGYLNMDDCMLQQLAAGPSSSDWSATPRLEVFMAAPGANSFYRSRGLSKYIPMAYSFVGALQLARLRQLWAARSSWAADSSAAPRAAWAARSSAAPRGGWPARALADCRCRLSRLFRKKATHKEKGLDFPPVLYEYDRSGWSFHSKGLWLYPSNNNNATGGHTTPTADDTNKTSSVESAGIGAGAGATSYPYATVIGSSNFGLRSRVRDFDLTFLILTQDPRLQRQFHREVVSMRKHAAAVQEISILVARCPRWLRFLLRWTRLRSLL